MTAEDTNALTSARLDLWLWSVRIFKTRSLAADECKGGHVRVNDAPAKPSQKLKKGDVVAIDYSADMAAQQAGGSEESSPFAPKHPGQKKKEGQK